MAYTFSYILEFRGGTYCLQVKSPDLKGSIVLWLSKIRDQKSEVKYLDENTLKEIARIIENADYRPIKLQGLKNIWFMHIPTQKGALNINIIQTDVS